MNGAFLAETAVFFKLDPVRIVLLVFGGIVVTLLAFGAFERDSYVFRFHCRPPRFVVLRCYAPHTAAENSRQTKHRLNGVL